MIRLQGISLVFGEQTIFNNISQLINEDQKIGLVGPNGAGKSTLLKVIAGHQKLTGGQVQISSGLRIAYLPQEVVLASTLSIFDETMLAYGELGQWHVRAHELERAGQTDCDEYATLQSDLAANDYGSKGAQARKVLVGLGFEQEKHGNSVATLSVGWQMRVVLAKLLLQDADMYLFDEPTNHLDLQAREWLCKFLRQSRSGYLLISHDRYVLDQVCEETYVIGKGKMRVYDGNYSYYRRAYEEQVAHFRAAKEAQDRDIAQRKQTIERFKAKASKAKMAKSMEKQLDRMEKVEFDEEMVPEIALPFPPLERPGEVVLRVEGLAKSFGDKLIFKDATFEVARGERIAIVAPNGAGKTTLLSCLYGAHKPDEGTFSFGHNVATAVFEQEQVSALNPNLSVFEEVENGACKTMRTQVRRVLGALLFSGDSVHKKIKVLSGGERNRVALAKILVQQVNMLILDEPTNHLDLLAQQVLTEGLAAYQGTVIFVSHDRDVVSKVATAIISIDQGKVSYYPGNYASFCYMRDQQTAANNAAAKNNKAAGGKSAPLVIEQAPKEPATKKTLQAIEREIAKIDEGVQKAVAALGDHDYGTPEYDRALDKYDRLKEQLDGQQKLWEECYAEMAK
ncbi:MAG: ATP-binding cassette, subfamily er 3 [Candidatus Dependentiae bacterium]|nr:ATP-binding cassette, subfamily er 3 [Candidatus Dependentiae bacterium]